MSDARTCLIIGGTTGIGKETAEYLAKKGWKIIVSGRSEAKGKQVVESIVHAKGSAAFYPVDVTSLASVQELHSRVQAAYGRIDAVFNNAGMSSTFQPFHTTPIEDIETTYIINQRGMIWCMQEQIKIMLKQEKLGEAGKRGVIVNMSSMSGISGVPFAVPYSTTKHAVAGLTRSTALEYASEGILISAVAPGVVDSGMPVLEESFNNNGVFTAEQAAALQPVNRRGKCVDVAKAVDFILENDFVTGAVISVDGGICAR